MAEVVTMLSIAFSSSCLLFSSMSLYFHSSNKPPCCCHRALAVALYLGLWLPGSLHLQVSYHLLPDKEGPFQPHKSECISNPLLVSSASQIRFPNISVYSCCLCFYGNFISLNCKYLPCIQPDQATVHNQCNCLVK